MGDADFSALKAAFSTAATLSEWATAIVVVGVAVEFVALLVFSKAMPKSEKTMFVIGSLLVVIGVGGEYVYGGRAASIAATLQQLSDEKVAGLKAQQEADHKIAATANERAAQLENETANLRRGISARVLPPEVRAQLKARFIGHHIPAFLICIPDDFESFSYGQQLARALAGAGMPDITMKLLTKPPGLSVGVIVVGRDEQDDRFVVSTLDDLGVAALATTGPLKFADCEAPFIFVGPKPPLWDSSACTTIPCNPK